MKTRQKRKGAEELTLLIDSFFVEKKNIEMDSIDLTKSQLTWLVSRWCKNKLNCNSTDWLTNSMFAAAKREEKRTHRLLAIHIRFFSFIDWISIQGANCVNLRDYSRSIKKHLDYFR